MKRRDLKAGEFVYQCPQCGHVFIDHESHPECLVGGHWTPHSYEDIRPELGVRCCHHLQERISDEPQAFGGYTVTNIENLDD